MLQDRSNWFLRSAIVLELGMTRPPFLPQKEALGKARRGVRSLDLERASG
jgi:hypothetical protein